MLEWQQNESESTEMKKLIRERLIADLKHLAAGANGCPVGNEMALVHCMTTDGFARFAGAVKATWLTDENGYFFENMLFFDITDIEKWETFDTLADAIIAERKRIDAVNKAKESDQ